MTRTDCEVLAPNRLARTDGSRWPDGLHGVIVTGQGIPVGTHLLVLNGDAYLSKPITSFPTPISLAVNVG